MLATQIGEEVMNKSELTNFQRKYVNHVLNTVDKVDIEQVADGSGSIIVSWDTQRNKRARVLVEQTDNLINL